MLQARAMSRGVAFLIAALALALNSADAMDDVVPVALLDGGVTEVKAAGSEDLEVHISTTHNVAAPPLR